VKVKKVLSSAKEKCVTTFTLLKDSKPCPIAQDAAFWVFSSTRKWSLFKTTA